MGATHKMITVTGQQDQWIKPEWLMPICIRTRDTCAKPQLIETAAAKAYCS